MIDLSADAALRLRLAEAIAREVSGRTPPAAVIITGSTATGCAMPGSDLDIVVFDASLQAPHEEERVVQGVSVGIEYYPLMLFEEILERRDLTLQELRLLGRVHSGLAVCDSGFFAELKARTGTVRLARSEMQGLLASASRMLEAAQRACAGSAARAAIFWRSAAESLAMALLTTRAPWYRQPKWTIADLRQFNGGSPAQSFIAVHGLEEMSGDHAAAAVEASAGLLEAFALASANVALRRQGWGGLMHRLHRKYLQNGRDMLAAGSGAEAVYCARVALDLRCAALCSPDLWRLNKLAAIERLFEGAQHQSLLDTYYIVHGLVEPDVPHIKASINKLSIHVHAQVCALYKDLAPTTISERGS